MTCATRPERRAGGRLVDPAARRRGTAAGPDALPELQRRPRRPHQLLLSAAGYAHFVVDSRGQGHQNPGHSSGGGTQWVEGFMTRRIEGPRNHYCGRLITDCVRAVDAAGCERTSWHRGRCGPGAVRHARGHPQPLCASTRSAGNDAGKPDLCLDAKPVQ
ncbi:acetylxylan esterase [Streptomyces sp. NPDC006733]|uniref:acetylxylan esterase n=1 Tax=Streptomyces sp. NPDC006733 TaxID=3155460 RepID=UPI0034058D45